MTSLENKPKLVADAKKLIQKSLRKLQPVGDAGGQQDGTSRWREKTGRHLTRRRRKLRIAAFAELYARYIVLADRQDFERIVAKFAKSTGMTNGRRTNPIAIVVRQELRL